jgi:hypothetical protein
MTATVFPGLSGRQSVSGTTADGLDAGRGERLEPAAELLAPERRDLRRTGLVGRADREMKLLDLAGERLFHCVRDDLRELRARFHGQLRARERDAGARHDRDDLPLGGDGCGVREITGGNGARVARRRRRQSPS